MNTAILRQFLETRSFTKKLCEPLETEDYVVQTIYDVSPIKWHLGHTTWFFETFILEKFVSNYKRFHDTYPFLFNSYYNTMGERVTKDDRGLMSRPTVNEIYTYREYVNQQMSHFIENSPMDDSLELLMKIGINHEQQHQELLTYDIKHIFFTNPLSPVYIKQKSHEFSAPDLTFTEFGEKVIMVGAGSDVSFAFDNEFPQHKVLVNPFRIRNSLVTNGEFLDFIESGGYQNHEFWFDDAWHLINRENWQHPLYWVHRDGEWLEWTFHGYEKLDLNKPLSHISQYEADAFSRFVNKRLPTEFEWEMASQDSLMPENTNFADRMLFDVTSENGEGLKGMHGNVWEWTSSAYLPYHGYHKPDGAIGEYNAKFMSGQIVLRGGSYATSKNHYRPTYRNFFQPEKRWLISGIRLAETL